MCLSGRKMRGDPREFNKSEWKKKEPKREMWETYRKGLGRAIKGGPARGFIFKSDRKYMAQLRGTAASTGKRKGQLLISNLS